MSKHIENKLLLSEVKTHKIMISKYTNSGALRSLALACLLSVFSIGTSNAALHIQISDYSEGIVFVQLNGSLEIPDNPDPGSQLLNQNAMNIGLNSLSFDIGFAERELDYSGQIFDVAIINHQGAFENLSQLNGPTQLFDGGPFALEISTSGTLILPDFYVSGEQINSSFLVDIPHSSIAAAGAEDGYMAYRYETFSGSVDFITIRASNPVSVPEPSSFGLLMSGAALLILKRRRQ